MGIRLRSSKRNGFCSEQVSVFLTKYIGQSASPNCGLLIEFTFCFPLAAGVGTCHSSVLVVLQLRNEVSPCFSERFTPSRICSPHCRTARGTVESKLVQDQVRQL